MIAIPRYSFGDVVNIMLDDVMESVKILETSIIVDSQEVFYKVALDRKKNTSEFVINEDQILAGYGRTPTPSFQVGDVVTFNYPVTNDLNTDVDWDVRTGVIEKVYICWDSDGYTVYYQTDETKEGEYTLEDDIITQEDIDGEVVNENVG
jgi:hypothetical protein